MPFWFLILIVALSLSAQGETNKEMIVLSGGPALRYFEKIKLDHSHDKYWFNFIDSACIRLRALKTAQQPGDEVSWLVYRPGYQIRGYELNVDLLKLIMDKANTLGVSLLWFDTKEELINYFNRGKDRKILPIGNFEYFGHSNKACLMFDYSNEYESQSRVFLHDRDFQQIKPVDFAADCMAKSWGCHSGEYYSVQWVKRFGIPMVGAIGKTDYSHLGELPFISSPDGRWVNGTEKTTQ